MQNANHVKELVQISRDGLEFYQDAMNEVQSERLKSVFSRMAGNKRTLIAALSSKLAMSDEDVPTDGTFAGSLRKTYTDIRAKLSSNEDRVYVSQLEETEDRLLKHFEKAIDGTTDPSVKGLLQQHFLHVRACHDEMRSLKQQLAA
jgi:uncharacterized protein (TIGR02284 family)